MNKRLSGIIVSALVALTAAGCASQTPEQQRATTGALIGGAGGALVGQAIGRDTTSTLVGAAVGAGAGALIGAATTPGYCRYRDQYGRVYEARCR